MKLMQAVCYRGINAWVFYGALDRPELHRAMHTIRWFVVGRRPER